MTVVAFVAGSFVGALLGVLVVALCAIQKEN